MNFYSVISRIQKGKGQVPLEVRVGGWVACLGKELPEPHFLPRSRSPSLFMPATQASGWVGGSLGVAQFFVHKINNEPKFDALRSLMVI